MISNKCVVVLVKVKVLDEGGNAGVYYTQIPTYRNAKLDMGDKKGLEVKNDDGTKRMKILSPKEGNHMKIGLQPLKQKSL